MSWRGHWHGFGPWVGSGAEYGREGQRRPGPTPNDLVTKTFLESKVPPIMTGHWLLRRTQASQERTWTVAEDAVAWLEKQYADHPPMIRSDGKQSYTTVEVKVGYAQEALPRGIDLTWAYWTTHSLVSFSVVGCRNIHHPKIACPFPPS